MTTLLFTIIIITDTLVGEVSGRLPTPLYFLMLELQGFFHLIKDYQYFNLIAKYNFVIKIISIILNLIRLNVVDFVIKMEIAPLEILFNIY